MSQPGQIRGEAQSARAGRADHQPRLAAWEMRVGNLFGELAVIDLVVVPANALFGHAGRAAGFENVERSALEFRRHPDFGLQIAQRVVLKVRKLGAEISEGSHFLARIETFLCPIEPERATALRREMPRDDFAQVGVELGLGRLDFGAGDGHRLSLLSWQAKTEADFRSDGPTPFQGRPRIRAGGDMAGITKLYGIIIQAAQGLRKGSPEGFDRQKPLQQQHQVMHLGNAQARFR